MTEEAMSGHDYEFVIVGGGLGGSVLAKAMAENGKIPSRLIKLESGTRHSLRGAFSGPRI
jgi:choline dehydrogenase-like flavoprotein